VQYCAEQIENDGDPVPAIVKGVKRAMAAEQSCRQYANEALRSASESKSEEQKQALIDLARTWNQMALKADASAAKSKPPKYIAR
jgi:hypothetical protein